MNNAILNVYILAAGYHKNDTSCSLWSFDNGKSILDWQIASTTQSLKMKSLNIVVGNDFQNIILKYPNLNFLYVNNWKKNGPLQSFLSSIKNFNCSIIAFYGDTVFHTKQLKKFNNIKADIVFGVDPQWKNRFQNRSSADIEKAEVINLKLFGVVEYTGLIKFSQSALGWLNKIQNKFNIKGSFLDLIEKAYKDGLDIKAFDINGGWAEMNESNDLIQFILGSKAETLNRIRPLLKKSKILEQKIIKWKDFKLDENLTSINVKKFFKEKKIIIRSSSDIEDSWISSQAGVFKSLLNIDSKNVKGVKDGISEVFSSYNIIKDSSHILIQPMVENVSFSGVIFTCDLETGAPYYIIDYDDFSGKTDTITSGSVNTKKKIIYRSKTKLIFKKNCKFTSLIYAVQEIENILGYNKIDIEFAFNSKGQLFIFQIRPIVNKNHRYIDKTNLSNSLNYAQQKFKKLQKQQKNILGKKTFYSCMTDWNPAEILGRKPNIFAASLYNHLITEDIWAKQRSSFGYRNVGFSPLIHFFCGQPYIDVRACFNSFIPEAIPDKVARNIIDAYMDFFRQNLHLHDKVEFEILYTVWTINFNKEAQVRFKKSKINKKDINILGNALKTITNNAFGKIYDIIKSYNLLKTKIKDLKKSKLDEISLIYNMVENCKYYGTPTFANSARLGFIAMIILKNMVKEKFLTQKRLEDFQKSIKTVSSDFIEDVNDKKLNLEKLIDKYGHLRSGTYDLNQLAYWESPRFFFKKNSHFKINKLKKFRFTNKEISGFKRFLSEVEAKISTKELIDFIIKSIQLREIVKFEFSKLISLSLDRLIEYGNGLGLNRNEISLINYDDIKQLKIGILEIDELKSRIEYRKKNVINNQIAKLPEIIINSDNFYFFDEPKIKANFITSKVVLSDIIIFQKGLKQNLSKKIVVIPNADPGFDWLFLKNITGLVTIYGGTNSHMAIRCAELGVPAAIGIGSRKFETLREGGAMMDCLNGHLKNV